MSTRRTPDPVVPEAPSSPSAAVAPSGGHMADGAGRTDHAQTDRRLSGAQPMHQPSGAKPGGLHTAEIPVEKRAGGSDRLTPRQRVQLLALTMAQFIVTMDGTVVMIALPAIAHSLNFEASVQLVLTGYVLAFGALLLLGGRIADLIGHRRTLVVGLVGFSIASAVGGLAPTGEVLVAARASQGVFAALLAPSALGLLSTSFTRPSHRATAFAAFGVVGTVGSAAGLLIGGAMTSYLSWRWTLWINVPIGVAAFALAIRVLDGPAKRARASRLRLNSLDVPGALLSVAGLTLLVLGTSNEGSLSIESGVVVALGVAVMLTFTWWERRARNPLVPRSVAAERSARGAYIALALLGASVLSMFYFLAQYTQVVLGYSAIQTGLLFMPNNLAVLVAATLTRRLIPRFGPKLTGGVGALLTAVGTGLLSTVQEGTHLFILVGFSVVMCFGLGLTMVTMTSTALHSATETTAGVGSALLTTLQQIGGAIGLGFAATIALLVSGNGTDGFGRSYFATGLLVAAGLAAAAAVVVFAMVARRLSGAEDHRVEPPNPPAFMDLQPGD